MPIFPEHKVIFIHIPKNMGTSLTKWMGLDNLDNSHLDLTHLFGQSQDRQLQHLKWLEITEYLERDQLATYRVIAVIRNPRERLLSEYCWLTTHPYWSAQISQHLTSFSKFLNHLERVYNAGQLESQFVHWHSQVSFLAGLDLSSPNVHLVLYDDAVQQLGRLVDGLGLNLDVRELECLNKSRRKPRLNADDHRHLDRVVRLVYPRDSELYEQLSAKLNA